MCLQTTETFRFVRVVGYTSIDIVTFVYYMFCYLTFAPGGWRDTDRVTGEKAPQAIDHTRFNISKCENTGYVWRGSHLLQHL